MENEVKEILEKLDNTKEIKRLKELNLKLNNNKNYIDLMKEFTTNKESYIKNNIYEEKLIEVRKKLFEIDELNEYLSIQNDLRLLFSKINNIIFNTIK